MPDSSRLCDLSPEPVGFEYPLPHLREALKRQRKIKIVAIGSSSTAGVDPVLSGLQIALRDAQVLQRDEGAGIGVDRKAHWKVLFSGIRPSFWQP